MSDHQERATEVISIWEDLKRRNVYRVGVGYVALSWLLIQTAEVIFPRIGFPDWSVTMAIVVSLAGFPIAIFLGWTFEITPKGIVYDRPRGVRWSTYLVVDVVIVVALVAAGSVYWFRVHEIDAPTQRQFDNSIAVLPFLDIGQDPDTEALAFGLSDELLTGLAQLEELKVSSRVATDYYADRTLPLAEIANGLDVKYLVEGSVHKEADRIRVTVQLIDALENDHVWADNYEKGMGGLHSLKVGRIARL